MEVNQFTLDTGNISTTVGPHYDTTDGFTVPSQCNELTSTNKQYNTDGFPLYITILGTAIGCIIIAVGMFGNVLIILSVILVKPLSKMSNSFIISLALWDLIQNVLVKPLYVHTYLNGEWTFGTATCVYTLYTSNLAILESILHVCVIALHRYLVIVHPRRIFFQHIKGVFFLLATIHIIPFSIVLLPSIKKLQKTLVMDEGIIFNKKIMFCSYVNQSEFKLAGVLKKVVFLGVAAAFIFFCYVRIYMKVKKSGENVQTREERLNPARIRIEWTLFKTLMIVFIAFVFSFLFISVLYGLDTNRNYPYGIYFIGVVLLWMSSSINWVIYGLLNKRYALAYRYILCGHPLPRTIASLRGHTTSISRNSCNGYQKTN